MKGFMKGLLWTALILVLIGIVALVIGFIGGGVNGAVDLVKDDGLQITGLDIDLGDVIYDSDQETYSGSVSMMEIAQKDEVKNLDIEIGGGKLVLLESENDYFGVKSTGNSDYQAYVEDKTLYIKGLDSTILIGVGSNSRTIYLYVPENELEECNIDLGGGEIIIDQISVKNLTTDLGAGSLEIKQLECEDAEISIGAGSCRVESGYAKNVDLSVGMGDINWEGKIEKDLSADCSMGQIILDLEGSETDHNYTLDCSLGEIVLGNSSYSGMASSKEINHNADSDYDISCSMGSIKIIF